MSPGVLHPGATTRLPGATLCEPLHVQRGLEAGAVVNTELGAFRTSIEK